MANSDYENFPEIKRNMKIIERKMLQIEDGKLVEEEKKDSNNLIEGIDVAKLQKSE